MQSSTHTDCNEDSETLESRLLRSSRTISTEISLGTLKRYKRIGREGRSHLHSSIINSRFVFSTLFVLEDSFWNNYSLPASSRVECKWRPQGHYGQQSPLLPSSLAFPCSVRTDVSCRWGECPALCLWRQQRRQKAGVTTWESTVSLLLLSRLMTRQDFSPGSNGHTESQYPCLLTVCDSMQSQGMTYIPTWRCPDGHLSNIWFIGQ